MLQQYVATVKRLFAYALAITLVPFLAGAVGMGIRLGTSSSTDTNPPPYAGALPTLHDRYGISTSEVARQIKQWL